MAERMVLVEAANEPLPALLVRPDEGSTGRAVVVIQEWWGLNDQIAGVARRLADVGFDALVPDLYRGVKAEEPDEAKKLAMALDRPRALRDIRASIGWLLDERATAVGIIGFCMGAGLVWELARSDDRLAAAVPCYGGVEFGEGGPAVVPFQAHFGAEDGFPAEAV